VLKNDKEMIKKWKEYFEELLNEEFPKIAIDQLE